jgi:hypothetical protein
MVLTTQSLIRSLLKGTREIGEVDLTKIFPRYTYDTMVSSIIVYRHDAQNFIRMQYFSVVTLSSKRYAP